MMHLRCDSCGQTLRVPEKHAGKSGRCPRCKGTVVVPAAQAPNAAGGQERSADLQAHAVDRAYDAALLDMAAKGKVSDEATGRSRDPVGLAEGSLGVGEGGAVQEAGTVEVVRPPWPIDAVLYPLNTPGLIHLTGLWLLLFFICPHIMGLGLGIEFVPVVYALPVAYALYYFAECVRDRAGGGRHAPDYWMHPHDSSKWDCLSQMFEVVGCIAVCFWPVSVYCVVRGRVDWTYWLLLAGGGFFFPMVLLAVVLFDSLSALNPVLIAGSILRTFVPYCGMVLLLGGGALLSVTTGFRLNGFHPLPLVPLLLWLVQLYLVFVATALLGGFYQRHKDRLDWGI